MIPGGPVVAGADVARHAVSASSILDGRSMVLFLVVIFLAIVGALLLGWNEERAYDRWLTERLAERSSAVEGVQVGPPADRFLSDTSSAARGFWEGDARGRGRVPPSV